MEGPCPDSSLNRKSPSQNGDHNPVSLQSISELDTKVETEATLTVFNESDIFDSTACYFVKLNSGISDLDSELLDSDRKKQVFSSVRS